MILECSNNLSWGIGIDIERKDKIKEALEEGRFPGRNLLGQLLQEVRQQLKESPSPNTQRELGPDKINPINEEIPLITGPSKKSKTTPEKRIKATQEITLNKEDSQLEKNSYFSVRGTRERFIKFCHKEDTIRRKK